MSDVPDVPDDDPRFTLGLAFDVGRVLLNHGYPALDGHQLIDLQAALSGFLYGTSGPGLDNHEYS